MTDVRRFLRCWRLTPEALVLIGRDDGWNPILNWAVACACVPLFPLVVCVVGCTLDDLESAIDYAYSLPQ
jgi:hypothetical protein